MVALLAWSASQFFLFLPAQHLPLSAAGSGKRQASNQPQCGCFAGKLVRRQTQKAKRKPRLLAGLSFGSPSWTRTNDSYGQKHGRLARLERFAILPVSFYSKTCFIVRRTRRSSSQLTATIRLLCSRSWWEDNKRQKKHPVYWRSALYWLPKLDSNQRPCGYFTTSFSHCSLDFVFTVSPLSDLGTPCKVSTHRIRNAIPCSALSYLST